jgi:hypothetical protein
MVLIRPGHPGEATILFGKARIEHAAEIYVSGRTSGANDHTALNTALASDSFFSSLPADRVGFGRRD